MERPKEIHDSVLKQTDKEKAWRNRMILELKHLGNNQKSLGEEAATLAEKKLTEARIFGRMLQKSAEAMKQAAAAFNERAEEALADPMDLRAAEEGVKLQQKALRRLDQLLEALKQEPGAVMRPAGGGGGGGDGDGGAGGGGGGDGIPPLVEY